MEILRTIKDIVNLSENLSRYRVIVPHIDKMMTAENGEEYNSGLAGLFTEIEALNIHRFDAIPKHERNLIDMLSKLEFV
jgi:hypothetical protein